MNSREHHDRLVDLLLSELLGAETPPDVRARVLEAAEQLPRSPVRQLPGRRFTVVRPVRKSRAPVLAAAAAVALIGAIGASLVLRGIAHTRTPMLASFEGTVNCSAGPVRAGETLGTGPSSKAVLRYPDGTVVELDPETTVMVPKLTLWDRSKGLELLTGKLVAEVSPQPEGRPMVLGTRDALAEVVGTALTLERYAGRSRLEVKDGAVRFVCLKNEGNVLVESGGFAEAGGMGFRHGEIVTPPRRGITGFTLMNADTDEPLRAEPLSNGERISLSSLPTRNINIRADYEGDPPESVTISIRRHFGNPTGLGPHASEPHKHPPFFVAGDHRADGRPDDCAAWRPPPGFYHLAAEATYSDKEPAPPLKVRFYFTN
jgi:hypothetical protein